MTMGSDFKLLRRRVGVVTLLLACVFAAGWMRSLYVVDRTSFSTSRTSALGIRSSNASLAFQSYRSEFPLRVVQGAEDRVVIRAPGSIMFNFSEEYITWYAHGFGFGIAEENRAEFSTSYSLYVFPYWSIVIPLTALSAWLLLSNSRIKASASVTNE